ncbi:hypothetical protein [Streptomyces sp. NPDC093225]|uniref:hypothetical protein n=1 Tax=Streptomyces sp. NPDC093225 TaxID=3366034 RepID=UPI00380ABCE0
MKKTLAVCAAAAAVAGLISAAGPAAATAGCKPQLKVLGTLGPADPRDHDDDGVRDLGTGDVAVGQSAWKPVYWKGTRVHAVPLPAGITSGEVLAVNSSGLMVGTYRDDAAATSRAFSYRIGDAAVTTLPEGESAGWREMDVNDAGYIVMDEDNGRGGLVWRDGVVVRRLALPPGSRPEAHVTYVTAINNRGDVLGTAEENYEVPETGQQVDRWYPVVWPADGGPAKTLGPVGDSLNMQYVQDIDESGRVVGHWFHGPWYEYRPMVWDAPYEEPGGSPGLLGSFPYGTFEAISRTTDVAVGTAKYHPDNPTLPDQAQLWTGSGPVRALPRLAPGGASAAEAVTDDDRAGGSAVDAKGVRQSVVWTCATKQAYLP